ncbi:hypothetical protein F3J37_01475 [Pantoea sp. Al-1710]|uniref:HrpE/YscL family type III secretion apparatus protein n=1 Tax=Candidatus Pantoea communis TaxID=2608354 RepID=A0ABX0RI80_9GAMM|nr:MULTISPECIES: HrpE/YscL family type III secretion apparatus protein [Pantoea]NIG12951.1 hypothetical protein [Pantoea sp. Cy-640]NIG17348.1 hypothetical protein [Pantoea communis]
MIRLPVVTLEFEPDPIEGVLITRQMMEEDSAAASLMEITEAHCQQLIEQTEKDIIEMKKKATEEHQKRLAQILEEMEQNFLDKSEGLFAEWYQERERDSDEITERAKGLVEKVFMAMLDQLPDEDKLHAVFRQIQRSANTRTEATLYHHPDHAEELAEWMSKYHLAMWALNPDDKLSHDELILATDKGELSLTWAGFQKHLVSRLM